MSTDRFSHPETSGMVPRVSKKNAKTAYMGTVRKPQREDELGAAMVVDLLFGGRMILWPHDADYYRVQRAD